MIKDEYILGIDLGRTNIKTGCFDSDLKLIGKISVPTHTDMSAEFIVDRCGDACEELLEQHDLSLTNVCAVGLGTPGRVCGCGQKGCVEAYGSASSTARRAAEAVEQGSETTLKNCLEDNGKISCKDVFVHAANGDALAKEIVEGTAKALALICVQLANITGPKQIVFAGGMIGAGDILLEQIREFFNQYIQPSRKDSVEICFSGIGEDAGIIGATVQTVVARCRYYSW